MFETKLEDFISICKDSVETLKQKKAGGLFSFTERIDETDLLDFFSAYESEQTDRWFWSNYNRDTSFVGIGAAKIFESVEADLHKIKKSWQAVLDNAIIHNDFKNIHAGPMIYGGIPFDVKKASTHLWADFNRSRFTLPQYMLIVHNGIYFATYNAYVDSETNSNDIVNDWMSFKKQFKNLSPMKKEPIKLIEKNQIEPEKWKGTVRFAKLSIKNQEAKKIVLAREIRIKLSKEIHVGQVLRRLLYEQTNSYVFAFDHGDSSFVGATPERLVRVKDDEVLSTCLAGTAPRGGDLIEDELIANELLADQKNRKEHEFVVDMIRQAMKPNCLKITIPEAPVVYPLKNLQHLYTPVRAVLKHNAHIFDLIEALHPTPALGGTPKAASLSFIRKYEVVDRGWYGAPIGWLDANHDGEFAVAIRSGLLQGKEASLFAGCGVVADSDPEKEFNETLIKFKPMLSVLEDNE